MPPRRSFRARTDFVANAVGRFVIWELGREAAASDDATGVARWQQIEPPQCRPVGAVRARAALLVTGIVQDELGRLTDRVYANGVVRSIAYDEQFSAPSTIQAWFMDGRCGKTFIQDDQFTRDGFGRVIQIADNANRLRNAVHESQCFVYDGHNRLARAWTLKHRSGQSGVHG